MTTVEIQQQFAANFYGVAHVMQGRVASPNCFPSLLFPASRFRVTTMPFSIRKESPQGKADYLPIGGDIYSVESHLQ